jgi:hypothetical protein
VHLKQRCILDKNCLSNWAKNYFVALCLFISNPHRKKEENQGEKKEEREREIRGT